MWQATYLPYGQEWPGLGASGSPPPNHYKFTGKERDAESGLDYFGARYYSSSYGRFITPDWATAPTAVPYAEFGDAQTLNLYTYVRNNPLSHADADGHCCSVEWKFFKAEVRGLWNATGGGVVSLGRSVVSGEAGRNIVTTAKLAVNNPGAIGEAGKQFGSQVVNTVKAAAQGNPEAIGEASELPPLLRPRLRKEHPQVGGDWEVQRPAPKTPRLQTAWKVADSRSRAGAVSSPKSTSRGLVVVERVQTMSM